MSRTLIMLLVASVLLIPLGIYLSAQEPCKEESVEALINNNCGGGASKWIAVKNEPTVCQIICLAQDPENPEKECGINPSWIGGTVYAEEGAEYGFNFDPSTVVIAEITAEGLQTNICQIADNPKAYDGALWYIPYDLREIR